MTANHETRVMRAAVAYRICRGSRAMQDVARVEGVDPQDVQAEVERLGAFPRLDTSKGAK